jgi:hypothetical protein
MQYCGDHLNDRQRRKNKSVKEERTIERERVRETGKKVNKFIINI